MENKKQLAAGANARRKFLRVSVYTALGALTTSTLAWAMVNYKQNYEARHDLSVVGNGIATVVQVHDPACRLCQQLRSNLFAAQSDFPEEKLLVRIADITSVAGAAFASQHQVPHVTLLFFDARGQLVQTLQSVTGEDDIHAALTSLVGRPR